MSDDAATPLYRVTMASGLMTIVRAEDGWEASDKAHRRAQNPRDAVLDVDEATESDVRYFEGMGGTIR